MDIATISLVSKSNRKAEVIIRQPDATYRTTHLLSSDNGVTYTDRFGTRVNLDAGKVDWAQYYRGRMLGVIRTNPDLAYQYATWLGHEMDLTGQILVYEAEDLVNQAAQVMEVVNDTQAST